MSKQHILVIDDDQGLVRMISEYLTAEGFEVSAAYSGSEGLATFRQNGPDLILLDWMLPEKSGIDVCREIREDSQIPIIMLTARGEEPDKVVGLELGADDYVTKPFSLRELIARIRTVLRRVDAHTQISSKKVVVGPLEVDVEGLTVYWAGHPVSLTATEYKILTAMAPHPNRVFSRSQLIEAALGGYFEGYERTVDSHISHLRRKLAAAGPEGEDLIQTHHGVGYKPVPPR